METQPQQIIGIAATVDVTLSVRGNILGVESVKN